MKKFISLVIVTLCFCACDDDEVKEYQTQCDSKESCQKECNQGNGAACYRLSLPSFEPSVEQRITYAQKSCDLHYAQGCSWLADLYDYDEEYGEYFAKKAFKMFQKSCEQSHNGSSCNSLGYLYRGGKGVTKDFEKALSYYEKACLSDLDYENENEGCRGLGDLYYEGKGVKKDLERAFSYHKKACELDDSPSIHFKKSKLNGWYYWSKASIYLKNKKYNEAKYFMEKSCQSDCFNEGLESAKNKGYIDARLYYEIACDKGSAAGCNNLGVLYGNGQGVAKNTAKAKNFYEKSCGMGSTMACQNVGYHYYNAREFAKAKAAFEKGCGANLADSCSFLGVLYEFGEGVRQDLSTAKSYYGKGCDSGSQRGCDGYKKLNQRGVR